MLVGFHRMSKVMAFACFVAAAFYSQFASAPSVIVGSTDSIDFVETCTFTG